MHEAHLPSVFDVAAILITLAAALSWLNHKLLKLPSTVGLTLMGAVASREMSEALIVNPYDGGDMARAIDTALRMPASEQAERIRLMRQQVREQNVYRWAGRMLMDAARIRQRHRILQISAREA
jgi:hypothetical protein